jgi:FkbM family methyltransferase
MPSRGFVKVRRRGITWGLRLENYLDREIFLHGEFEPRTTELVREFLKPGMRVLDVGANFGYFTLIFARLVGTTGRVWAFEPAQTYRERLFWHLRENAVTDRVVVLDYGLSAREETRVLHIGDSSATLHPAADEASLGSETIRLRSLDGVAGELALPRIDLVKVDIDGHEPYFLAGAERLLAAQRPALVMEFSQNNLATFGGDVLKLKDQIERLGYELFSEKTGRPFATPNEFLIECGNYAFSANVWARARQ